MSKFRRKSLTDRWNRLHHNCQGQPRLFLSPTLELHSNHHSDNETWRRGQAKDKDKDKDKAKDKDKDEDKQKYKTNIKR